jgi:CRP-like cAMP-binding protein
MPPSANMLDRSRTGTLEDFLSTEDLAPLRPLAEIDWDTIRKTSGRRVYQQFFTLRNLLKHRGFIFADALGFAWGAIYRDMLVSSIISSSYRNGGHFRISDRASGTGDFFSGSFALPRSKGAFPEILRMVNLRHHVAGMVEISDSVNVCVVPRFEAEYTYVATSFIEAIRRGMAKCGLPKNSAKGREIGSQICTILYQIAGHTGLTRAPRDLDAHDRFCQAFEQNIQQNPPSDRVRWMAQKYARGMIPFTAARARETVKAHVKRHLDAETAEFLFPGGEIPKEIELEQKQYRQIFSRQKTLPTIIKRSNERQIIWERPDVAALHQAYQSTAGRPGPANGRLIGAILLNAIVTGRESNQQLERRTIHLAAGETLIQHGEILKEMYVLLSATAPLAVESHNERLQNLRQLTTVTAPHIIGIMGMWRGEPEASTIFTRVDNLIDVIVIDTERFNRLNEESGFKAAMTDEVRRRLSLNASIVGELLQQAATSTNDPLLNSIEQLFRYLSGDSHTPLNKITGLDFDASPAEYVEALRAQASLAIQDHKLSPELQECLKKVMWYM